jgi:hypothetical protein
MNIMVIKRLIDLGQDHVLENSRCTEVQFDGRFSAPRLSGVYRTRSSCRLEL